MKAHLYTCGVMALLAATQVSAQTQPAQGGAGQPAPAVTRPLGLTQDAWNARLRLRGESKSNPGYIRYIYNPANVFPIRTRESMITTIKLPDDTELLQAFAGDDQGFQVGIPTPNSIAIKALFPGVDTNLVAYTKDGKIFTFYVRSEGYNSKVASDFLVDVIMPGGGAVEGSSMTSENQILQDQRYVAQTAERVRDPYGSLSPDRRERYREYAEWSDFKPGTVVEDLGVYVPRKEAGGTIPYRVFHDDRFTYVDFGPNATQMTEWPTPLIVVQGVEGPVGFRTAGPGGRMIVMEALGSFVLRNGQRIIIIKPRRDVVPGDKTLIEYPVAGVGPMSVPTDLPPGRPATLVSAPRTVVPTNGRVTANGEAPSAVVSLPQTRKVVREQEKRDRKDRKAGVAIVQEIDAPAPAAPVRTVVTTSAVSPSTAAGVAMGAEPATMGNGAIRMGSSVTTTPLRPTTDMSAMSTYKIVLGRGAPDQVEDRWKSYRVQHFGALGQKTMTPEPLGDGTVAMAITPVATIAEGMRLCTTLGADGGSCTVKPAKTAR
jgi:ComB9 competence protein